MEIIELVTAMLADGIFFMDDATSPEYHQMAELLARLAAMRQTVKFHGRIPDRLRKMFATLDGLPEGPPFNLLKFLDKLIDNEKLSKSVTFGKLPPILASARALQAAQQQQQAAQALQTLQQQAPQALQQQAVQTAQQQAPQALQQQAPQQAPAEEEGEQEGEEEGEQEGEEEEYRDSQEGEEGEEGEQEDEEAIEIDDSDYVGEEE
jgi:CDP-glycerol glycerophosphotransferase (TagB/SpsB family)